MSEPFAGKTMAEFRILLTVPWEWPVRRKMGRAKRDSREERKKEPRTRSLERREPGEGRLLPIRSSELVVVTGFFYSWIFGPTRASLLTLAFQDPGKFRSLKRQKAMELARDQLDSSAGFRCGWVSSEKAATQKPDRSRRPAVNQKAISTSCLHWATHPRRTAPIA